MAPTVTIALAADARSTSHWIETGPGRTAGVVVIDTPPSKRPNLSDIAEAALVGLGKDERLTFLKRHGLPLATAWLGLDDITEAFVVDAGALADDVLADTLAWLSGLGINTTLTFVANDWTDHDALGARIDTLASDWAATIIDDDQLTARWPKKAPKTPRLAPAGLPTLPRVDGCMFRAAMRADFDDDTFARIDAKCRSLVDAFRGELRQLNSNSDILRKSGQFERILRDTMAAIGPAEELHLTVRAAQIAGLLEGYLVSVDPVAFFGGAHAVPRRGQAIDELWWEKLDQYRDPDFGATAALYLAGCDPRDLGDLTVASISATTSVVEVTTPAGATITVDGPGARFVRALLSWRLAGGAGPDDGLFVTHRSSVATTNHIAKIMRTPGEVGIAYAPTPIRREQPTAKAWLLRHGITISKLVKGAQG